MKNKNNDNDLALNLPNTLEVTLPHLSNIMSAFNLSREIIASDEEISYACKEMEREINRIPYKFRDELVVKMCIATSVGPFYGAVNYIWNAVIATLKRKVKNFGFSAVVKILGKEFGNSNLDKYRDEELLYLYYKLGLLSDC